MGWKTYEKKIMGKPFYVSEDEHNSNFEQYSPLFKSDVVNITKFTEEGMKEHREWIERVQKVVPWPEEDYNAKIEGTRHPFRVQFFLKSSPTQYVDTLEEAISLCESYNPKGRNPYDF